jgi:hypothetical protein
LSKSFLLLFFKKAGLASARRPERRLALKVSAI